MLERINLAPQLASAIAQRLHLPLDVVHVGFAHYDFPAALSARDVTVGQSHIDLVRIYKLGFAESQRRVQMTRVTFRGLHVEQLELLQTASTFRAHAWQVQSQKWPIAFREVTAEGDSPKHLRVVATAGTIFGLTPVSILGRIKDDTLSLKIVGPHVDINTTFEKDRGAHVIAELDKLPLSPLAAQPQLFGSWDKLVRAADLTTTRVSGRIEASGMNDSGHASWTLAIDGINLQHPYLASDRHVEFPLGAEGELSWQHKALTVSRVRFSSGELSVIVHGAAKDGALSLSAELQPLACEKAFLALPAAMRPHLAGLQLQGDVSAEASLKFDLRTATLPDPDLSVQLHNACKVLAQPADFNLSELRGNKLTVPSTFRGHTRQVVLGPANPHFVPLSELPRDAVRAILVAEDSHFFQHPGVDLQRVRTAIARDLSAHQPLRGASTITQQLAKNLFLSGERSASRKLEELVLVWQLEQHLQKERILELYLNLVEFGPDLRGLDEAAQFYFHKGARDLTLNEAAQLAALLPAPYRGMDAHYDERLAQLRRRLPHDPVVMPKKLR